MENDAEKLERVITCLGDDAAKLQEELPEVADNMLEAVKLLTVITRMQEGDMRLEAYITEQIQFSRATFGPGARAAGVVDHIRKELAEIEAAPDDLEEWVDVIILALDGAWRAGYTPEQITAQMRAKLDKNKQRDWPDWRTVPEGKAIEHVRV